jgi:diadenosine tetraphosphatase ApaH/serine/threonine PP2A family protein phosphatase
MRVAVISDIHGNWHALDAVLAAVDADAPDELWCLGDLVGYGPQPNRCTDEVRARAALCLVGNHDLASLDRIDLSDFHGEAAASVRWTRDTLSEEARTYLDSLPSSAERHGVASFHASPRDPVWEYVLSEEVAHAALTATSTPLVLVGHSHVPLAVVLADGHAEGGVVTPGELELGAGRWLANPGSVGQPRDGDPRAAYLLVDLDERRAHFRRVEYEIAETQKEIVEAGLPQSFATRLAHGL